MSAIRAWVLLGVLGGAAAEASAATPPSVEGRVVDAHGNGVAAAAVAIEDLGLQRESGWDGSFRFPTLLLGAWTITATAGDDRSGSLDIHVGDAEPLRVEIVVRPREAGRRGDIRRCPASCSVMRWRTSPDAQRAALESLPADLRAALTNRFDDAERQRSVRELASPHRIVSSFRRLVPLLDDADEAVVSHVDALLYDILDENTEDLTRDACAPFLDVLAHGGMLARAHVVELMRGALVDGAEGVIAVALDDASAWIRGMAVSALRESSGDLTEEALAALLAAGRRLQADADDALADPEPGCLASTVEACRGETLARATWAAFAALELLMEEDCEWRHLAVAVLAEAVEGDPRLVPLAAKPLGDDSDDCTRQAQIDALVAGSACEDSGVRQGLAWAFASLMASDPDAIALDTADPPLE